MAETSDSYVRIDAQAKVSGKAQYPGDFNLPGQLYMKVLFAGKAHAVIKKIDVTEALVVSGVVTILTARDVPNNEYGLGVFDQPVCVGRDRISLLPTTFGLKPITWP